MVIAFQGTKQTKKLKATTKQIFFYEVESSLCLKWDRNLDISNILMSQFANQLQLNLLIINL